MEFFSLDPTLGKFYSNQSSCYSVQPKNSAKPTKCRDHIICPTFHDPYIVTPLFTLLICACRLSARNLSLATTFPAQEIRENVKNVCLGGWDLYKCTCRSAYSRKRSRFTASRVISHHHSYRHGYLRIYRT